MMKDFRETPMTMRRQNVPESAMPCYVVRNMSDTTVTIRNYRLKKEELAEQPMVSLRNYQLKHYDEI